MNTGEGNQKAMKSWFPLSTTWDEAGENYGRWTPYNESWFQKRLRDIQSGIGPLTASQWRDRLRGLNAVRRLRAGNEKVAQDILSREC